MKLAVTQNQLIERSSSCLLFQSFGTQKVLAGISLKSHPLVYDKNNPSDFLVKRDEFFTGLGLTKTPVLGLGQVHKDGIAVIQSEDIAGQDKADIPETDAVMTSEPNIILTIRTADCVPVFLFDERNSAMALAHAGWKGARAGIVRKTIIKMSEIYGTHFKDLKLLLGPSIRQCCYEFNSDVIPEFQTFMKEVSGKRYFDLAGFILNEVLNLGVVAGNVFDSELCTYCREDDFYSYRRNNGETGRMISFMMLKK